MYKDANGKSVKKIMFFISTLQKGGAERVLVNLAEYFYHLGYHVVIVTQYIAKEEYTISDGIVRILSEIEDHEIGKSRILNFCKRCRKLRTIWKEGKPNVILSFMGKNNIMALLTSWGMKIPVVVSVRAEPREEYKGKLLTQAALFTFRRATNIVMQTEESKSFFPMQMRDKIVVLQNPLHPSFIRQVYQGEREKTIVAVGRVDENKNHKMLIASFAQIAEKYPEYLLKIYGNGECKEELEKLIKNLGLEHRAYMMGAVDHVADVIEKAGVFVLTSYSEGMPNTLMEAMALGIPSIATDCPCGGPKELIQSGENGILIPVGSKEELTRQLDFLLGDDEIRKEIGRNATKLQESHNLEVVNESWKKLLDESMKI